MFKCKHSLSVITVATLQGAKEAISKLKLTRCVTRSFAWLGQINPLGQTQMTDPTHVEGEGPTATSHHASQPTELARRTSSLELWRRIRRRHPLPLASPQFEWIFPVWVRRGGGCTKATC